MEALGGYIAQVMIKGNVKEYIKKGERDKAIKYLKGLLKKRNRTSSYIHPLAKELLAKIEAKENF